MELIGLLILGAISLWAYQDANKRGENGLLWAIAIFFFLIIFLPWYLIVRKPLASNMVANVPPQIGGSTLCHSCGKYYEGRAAAFCPLCGSLHGTSNRVIGTPAGASEPTANE